MIFKSDTSKFHDVEELGREGGGSDREGSGISEETRDCGGGEGADED